MPILVKIDQEMRPWECSQTDRQTDRHTDTQTDENRFYNLSHAICYSCGTDNKVYARNVVVECCSCRAENPRQRSSFLSTSTARARVCRHPSRYSYSDETVLGRRTVWKTFVWWSCQSSQDRQQWKVSIVRHHSIKYTSTRCKPGLSFSAKRATIVKIIYYKVLQ